MIDVFNLQLIAREEKLSRFTLELRDSHSEGTRIGEELRRADAELRSSDEEKKRLEDVVSAVRDHL